MMTIIDLPRRDRWGEISRSCCFVSGLRGLDIVIGWMDSIKVVTTEEKHCIISFEFRSPTKLILYIVEFNFLYSPEINEPQVDYILVMEVYALLIKIILFSLSLFHTHHTIIAMYIYFICIFDWFRLIFTSL